ncbi:hypothetical protein FD754_023600, partial [Muntiacus muntjak]
HRQNTLRHKSQGCGEKGTLLHCWWECKLVQPLWKTVWRFLKKLEIELPYDPAIPLLGIHTEESRSERDTCTPVCFHVKHEINAVLHHLPTFYSLYFFLHLACRYSSHLDEIPASSGGRNNHWRRLSLENIPRTMIMYDIVDYAESGIISNRLKREMKYLLQRPKTEEMHQHQLQIVSEVRSPLFLSSLQPLYRPYQQQSQIRHLGRRSKQALIKVEKMKRAYKMAKEKNASVGSEPKMDIPGAKQKETVVLSTPSFDIVKVKELLSDDELEKEEKELFAWCQDLFINNSPF